ncbi:MAG: nucleoside hydrolase [Sphingomonas sp.]
MSARIRVWIDTDPTVLPGGFEVDDGLALAQAFQSPELDVVGVSSVFGNGDIDTCHASAVAMVSAFGPAGMTVARGAGRTDEPADTAAARAIIAAARAAPAPGLTLLALGPITNIASALTLAPDITRHIGQIIWVAGRLPGEVFKLSADQQDSFPDLNFEKDPGAAATVIAAGVPIILAPWAGSSQLKFTAEHVARLADDRSPAACLHRPASDWLAMWTRLWGVDYFMPFDTLAVGCAYRWPGLGGFAGGAWIEQHGASPPQLLVAVADKAPKRAPHVWFCNEIAAGFVDDVSGRIAGRLTASTA